jgi:hypothetical protein
VLQLCPRCLTARLALRRFYISDIPTTPPLSIGLTPLCLFDLYALRHSTPEALTGRDCAAAFPDLTCTGGLKPGLRGAALTTYGTRHTLSYTPYPKPPSLQNARSGSRTMELRAHFTELWTNVGCNLADRTWLPLYQRRTCFAIREIVTSGPRTSMTPINIFLISRVAQSLEASSTPAVSHICTLG